ncbi:type II toxin-antitoxin system HicB family antitoxin [Methylocystis sp. SB2]|uniref:type II toxin-antitoxin system HicB family antitoxin n=1 Tax=Methylocystis sp. (strain SB2) TaxID=743836 RepID=UPI001EFB43DF|nr:type II toxin-antitoxin system HicB family antitoxin [Methylocystis sp. SB2]ULO22374.1 type II toxin-antitoxin system HicB family antitoxin [Methylocystis sp. SB2]
MERKMEPHDLLKKPYARVVVPEADGSFTAEIIEFPGCVATGDTAAEAVANVEEVALDWIDATLEQGQDIPEPLDRANYSGKLVVRMSKGLHKRAALAAERDGVSLNQFIVTCIAEQVGTRARPVVVYTQPQIFAFHVGTAPALTATPGAVATCGQLGTQQMAATTGQQLINLPIQNRREREQAHA